MTTYNTGNAVGSTDPRDLSDNAENLDRFANGTNTAYDDRLGVSRKSLAGMESDFATDQSDRATTFANFLASSGYVGTGTGGAIEDYAGGIEITEYNQLIRESGEFYRAKASLSLPYTTTGTWAGDDETRFVSVGDAALRQEIGSGIFRADSLANLESTPGRFDGDAARLASGTGRDGDFRWDSSDLSSTLVLASATSDSVDDTTDTINDADHPFSDGDGVITQTTVNGLTAQTVYWVVNSTSGSYQLSATFGGGAVDLTGTTNFTVDHLLDPLQGIYVTTASDKTGASGAWSRPIYESRNVMWFGAIGDGVSDDAPAFISAVNFPVRSSGASAYGSKLIVPVPRDEYRLSTTIQIKTTVHIEGNGGSGLDNKQPVPLRFDADTAGIIVHRSDTFNDGTQSPATTAGDASIISGLSLIGSGTDSSKDGLWLRCRAIARDCRISGFPGNGFRVEANVASSPRGNANLWRASNMRITGCGLNGAYAAGSDANAGVASGIDCTSNRLWGIWDNSFLGNAWVGCHVEANGSDLANGKSAFAQAGGVGQTYQAVPGATESQLVATEPGTDANVWRECNSAPSISWTGAEAEGTFRQGGGVYTSNANARASIIGQYIEGGQGLTWLSAQSLAVGGFLSEAPVATGAAIVGRFGTASAASFRGAGTDPSSGAFSAATIGGNPGVKQLLYLEAEDDGGANSTGPWRLQGISGSDTLVFRNQDSGSRTAFNVSGASSARPWRFGLSSMNLGSGFTERTFGRVNYSTSSGVVFPTSGDYTRGDVLLAPNPNAGDFIGLVCTTSGTAGSTAVFKKFGAINA